MEGGLILTFRSVSKSRQSVGEICRADCMATSGCLNRVMQKLKLLRMTHREREEGKKKGIGLAEKGDERQMSGKKVIEKREG